MLGNSCLYAPGKGLVSGQCSTKEFELSYHLPVVDISTISRNHWRVEMGCSPLDGAYKYTIGTALLSSRWTSTIGKIPVINI
eukprot:343159-Pelagomonas_calceolata.AAC.1